MKTINEDLEPINLETLGKAWPDEFTVTCNNGSFRVYVDTVIQDALFYNLVVPIEDYNYAITQYIKSFEDFKDIYIDILTIIYDPALLIHFVEPIRVIVEPIQDIEDSESFNKNKLILQFSDFINTLISK